MSAAHPAPELVGQHPVWLRLLERVDRVARAPGPVLILGETGTGKELIAARLHAASGRRGLLVPVNCGQLGPELLEAELFGARRGAYTGASEARSGLVRAAEGGTLFLDEIGELCARGQAMLLRFLSNGMVRELGGTAEARVDVRVVAATHRDLQGAVELQEFRRDLYHRLAVHLLPMPPLRERGNDILLMARSFLGARAHLGPCAERWLVAYPWWGNVRELQAMMARVELEVGAGPVTRELLVLTETANPARDRDTRRLRDAWAYARRNPGASCRSAAQALGLPRGTWLGTLRRAGLTWDELARRDAPP